MPWNQRLAFRFLAVVILTSALLTASLARAQDDNQAGAEGGDSGQGNTVVVTPDSSDSNQDSEAEVNPNQSGGMDESPSPSAPQAAAYPDANSGSFADLNQFLPSDDVLQSPLGALLQRNCSQLTKGPLACGLAVLEIRPGSPAALAGLRPYSGLVHTLLGASIVGAGMAFPPAIAALGLVEQSHVGEKYDLIIAVDGVRIRTISDFQNAVPEIRVGDVLYLTVIRQGKRLQIPMRIQSTYRAEQQAGGAD